MLPIAHAAYQYQQIPTPDPGAWWANLVSQTGFPIVVSLWMLYMFDRKLSRMISLQERIITLLGLHKGTSEEDTQ